MNKKQNTYKELIKRLLSDNLTPEERNQFLQMKAVRKEIQKQWETGFESKEDFKIKQRIWKKIKNKCFPKHTTHLFSIPTRYSIAASVVLLISIGGYWLYNIQRRTDRYIEVTADKQQLHILPDSSKVWMQPGSSLHYAQAFKKERKVWLEGSSLFEVRKQGDKPFQVQLEGAYIEVKGTSFLVTRVDGKSDEITLFNGSIEFNVEPTHQKTQLKPLQKIIYNANSSETKVESLGDMGWKNERFHFIEIPLDKLIQFINKLYNVSIKLEADIDKNIAFTGKIRYNEPLDDVVTKICYNLNLQKEYISEKEIIIKKKRTTN